MKNKKILLGMLVIALTFGMTVTGCEDETDVFLGTWTGIYQEEKGDASTESEATIVFADSAWTLTYGKNETKEIIKGTYTAPRLMYTDLKSGTTVGVGSILTILQIQFTSGEHKDGFGYFCNDKYGTMDEVRKKIKE
jgi:hypothetical protein